MTFNINLLHSLKPLTTSPLIHTTNGATMHITHTGHATSQSLQDIYYIPRLTLNIVYVGQLVE